jgi:alpha-N-arabinofuranosidase
MLRTPNYYVFDLYKSHQNGTSVRTVFGAPTVGKAPLLDGSASLHEDGRRLVVTCTHAGISEPLAVELRLEGSAAQSARAMVLAGAPREHNTFDQPERVKPRELPVTVRQGRLAFEMPPCSVAALEISLG